MHKPIVLTIIAEDQPGIVNQVSQVLKEHGGNWTRSSMSHLAGRFAGILMANLPGDREQDCLDALRALHDQGIEVIAKRGEASAENDESQTFLLEVVGNDRPGIVADMTRVIAAHGVSIHGLKTAVESASMSGGELFRANAKLSVPETSNIDAVAQELESMANDLMVELSRE